MHLVDRPNSTFTNQELARLAAYRAAVRAHFYTDWDGTAECTDLSVLAELGPAGAPLDAEEPYPFTVDERQRLERCRTAVANGTCTDDLPPADSGATPGQQTR